MSASTTLKFDLADQSILLARVRAGFSHDTDAELYLWYASPASLSASFVVNEALTRNDDSAIHPRILVGDPCPSSKRNPHVFFGRFTLVAIACLHGHADQRSGSGRLKRTPGWPRVGTLA